MATRLFSVCSPVLAISQDSDKGLRKSGVMMCCSDNPLSVINLQIRSFDHKVTKVFEDRSAGIVCYKDENGEITCEGYDEGPRFHQQNSRFTCNSSRDVEIIDLLQRCWLHDKDNINCNGVNKL